MGFLSYISSNVLVAGNAEPVYIMGDFQGDVVAIQNNDQAWRLSVGSQPVTHLTRIGNAEDIDVVAVTVNGEISRIQNGTELWSRQPVTAQPLGLAVADINRDGQEEIILALVDLTEFDKLAKTTTSPTPPSFTKLLVLDQQGNFIGNDGGEHEIENLSSSPTVGDINGDGYLNIVVRSSTHLYVFNYNGSLAEEFPVEVEGNDGIGWDLLPQPIIADLDNDGKLDILTGTRNGLLKAYNRYGEMLDGFPIAVGGPVQATPALGDIDANGTLDLVVAAEDRFVYAWDLEVPADVDIAWGTYGHDLQHTFRNADTAPAPQPTGPGLLVKKSVYNYPNPARGGQTMIHYVVNESCTIRVRIYNLAGELVAELGDGAAPIVDNEVIWQLDNVSSGVYMARVEADNGTTKEHAFCTIAVIK